jgi:hypothetical protein
MMANYALKKARLEAGNVDIVKSPVYPKNPQRDQEITSDASERRAGLN